MTYHEHKAAKVIDGSKQRERIIVRQIQLHPSINHNGLKRLVVPKYMAVKTFDHTMKNLVERRVINLEKIGNQHHYTVALGYPDDTVKTNLENLSKLLDEMKKELKELKERYPKFSKDKKTQLVLDLSNIYWETRVQVVKIFELLGKAPLLGEYDAL